MNPQLQEQIAQHHLRKTYGQQGGDMARAARVWYSGSAGASDLRPKPNEPSPNEYAAQVIARACASTPQVYGPPKPTASYDSEKHEVVVKIETPPGVAATVTSRQTAANNLKNPKVAVKTAPVQAPKSGN